MLTLTELGKHCRELIKQHPDKRDDIIDVFQLAQSEVEEGESEIHEVDLALGTLEEIIQEES